MTTTAADLTVSARGLGRHYGSFSAVGSLDLHLKRGEILGFLGPNGAGKSTSMQMLTGNLAPTSGTVEICGVDLLEHPTAAKAHLGYLPETPPLYRELNVREYLDLAARLRRVPKAKRRVSVDSALVRCGLKDVARQLIGTLSKGYQQRVGIAQAIVHAPDVVILDEPTIGLDPNQIRDIRQLIRELGQNHSVILSTHILPEVETVCDRVQILHRGKTVFSDTIGALKAFKSDRVVTLGLKRPPALEELQRVQGIASAEAAGGGNRFRLGLAGNFDAEALARVAVERNWGLFELMPSATSLEEVFSDLTRREQP
ncbi:MAG: ABC transporter ATP-binding protein [Burkholderiales bacterium]